MRWTLIVALMSLAAPALAEGDIRVLDSVDVVRLVDGREIRGTVIASGMRSVIVLIEGREQMIRRADVKEIVRGEALPMIRAYKVENVDGLAVVVGEGSGDNGVPAVAADRAVAAAPAATPTRTPAAAPDVIPPETVKELMKDPRIGNLVRQFGGEERALQMLRQHGNNPIVRNFLDEFRRTGRVPAGLESFISN